MRKLLLLGCCLFSFLLVNGQQLRYEYRYDNAGNRVRRTVILVNGKSNNGSITPLTDVMNNGETMRLYPNPTTESIRFELAEDKRIGSYVLSDINGRPVINGSCEASAMTLDLSRQSNGVYFLELFIEGEKQIYKIIKQ